MYTSSICSTPRKVLCLIIAGALILTPLFNLRYHSVQAFMPTKKLAFTAGGVGTWSHAHITEAAIAPLYHEFFGQQLGRTTDAQNKAVANIVKHVASVDFSEEFYLSAPHFDGENFHEAQERLKSFKAEAANLMQGAPANARVSKAQSFLGRALHTLQDFYSHSNWAEEHPTGQIEPFHVLGDLNVTLARPSKTLQTCMNCARNLCFDCENILLPTNLTTGYYGSDKDNPKPGPWKCSHGGTTALGGDSSGAGLIKSGINKDTLDCVVSPHDQFHRRAARFAIAATQEYLRELKDLIGLSKMSVLLGGSPRLAFVVDTTGSMSNEIASVRQQILQIIDARVSLGLPTTYTLIPFNDPSVGTITTTDDPNEFRNAVNALSAFGGGDCPEPINNALIRAFGEMDSGGDIMLFTDARPSDSNLAFSVGTFARTAGVRLTSVFSGANDACPPLDSSFATLAFDTGGQFFSLLPSEVGLVSNLSNFLALPDEADLFATIGFSSAQDQIYPIPIDISMTRMILSVTGTGATNVVVRRPDNTIVQPTDPNVSQIAVSSGVVYSILSPVVGTWTITMPGTSGEEEEMANQGVNGAESGPSNQLEATTTMQGPQEFSIRVAGESTTDVKSFDFVEVASNRPGHEGDKPVESSPIPGQATKIVTTLAEGATNPTIQLRSLDNSVLQTLSLQEIPWPGDSLDEPEPRLENMKDYFADVTVPTQPFQVYLTGQDANGNPYQRLLPGVYRPQTVEIIAPPMQNLHPGESLSYSLTVKNSGPADTFQLTAVDDEKFIAGITPSSLTLGTNETKSVTVLITVPTNAVPLTTDTLRFTALGSLAHNTAVVGPFTVNPIPVLGLGTFTITPIGGNGNGVLDPGEGAALNFQLINNGPNTATNISAGISTTTPQIVISQGGSDYPDLAPSASATNLLPFVVYVPPDIPCGQKIQLTLSVTSEGNGSASAGEYHVTVLVGQPAPGSNVTQSFTGPPVAIPDNNPAGVSIPLTVSGVVGTIDDLDFRIDGTSCTNAEGATTVGLDHTFVSDLVLTLRSPAGTEVNLINFAGGDGNNFCNTLLDDQSTNSIQDVIAEDAPFTGTFKPNQPLSAFNGEDANGVWTLIITDNFAVDVGSVRGFSLIVSTNQFTCSTPAPADTTAPSCAATDFRPGPPAAGDISTQDTGTGLAAINVIAAENVNVTVPAFTPGTTAPVVVTGTLIDAGAGGSFQIQSVDVAGNVSTCARGVNMAEVGINDAQLTEPTTGQANMLFTVALSAAATSTVNVDFQTFDGGSNPATAGSDYSTTSGSLTFSPGQRVKTIAVPILSDSNSSETDETFLVNLTAASGAVITHSQAVGTIRVTNSPGTLIISELRTFGPGPTNDPNDDFVEIYNNTALPITVPVGGYGLFKISGDCDTMPVLVGTIPASTVIPAQGHFLFTGSAYSLGSYGGSNLATGNATLSADIENNSNVALFATTNVSNISSQNRFDAVGFGTQSTGNCALLAEGNTVSALTINLASLGQHSFIRDQCGKGGSNSILGLCPTSGALLDVNNNVLDFFFVDSNGVNAGAGARLGAPGPENLGSPLRRDTTTIVTLLDNTVAGSVVPNRVRDFTPVPNGANGTLSIRRRYINTTGSSITKLRFRVIDISTFPASGSIADVRLISSVAVTGVTVNDSATCAATGTPSTAPCTVTVQGTTLEQPPTQSNAGGFNSTVSAGTITLGTPLPAGASINVQFLLGVQQSGTFKIWVSLEALP